MNYKKITSEQAKIEIERLKDRLHENNLALIRAEIEGVEALLTEVKELLLKGTELESLKVERTKSLLEK